MEEDYDFAGRSEGEVLLSFSANKGHRTRQAKKITNLLALQDQKYSKTTELSLIHISEPTRLGMISYAVFCLKKKKQ